MMRLHHLWLLTLIVTLQAPLTASASAESRPDRLKFEYIPPANPGQQKIYELMKKRRALETVQEMFSPVRLPVDLKVRMKTCGVVNAWYQRSGPDAVVTICYDYMAAVLKQIPDIVMSAELTAMDAIDGQFFYTAAHEVGHAMFDLLAVPSFGRQEDNADEFAAYIMLQTGKTEARRLIMAAAQAYNQMKDKPRMAIEMKAFADVHGTEDQRYYNLLCLAYGAKPDVFADVVNTGMLPESRAKGCSYEYAVIAYAFTHLIRPHLDPKLANDVMRKDWLPPEPTHRR